MDPNEANLLKYCLENSSSTQHTTIPQRDPQDYVWLREALDNLQSEADKMKKHLTTLQMTDSTEHEKLLAMEDLQCYVEDLDNSNDFFKIGGLHLLRDYIDCSSSSLRYWSAWIISTLVQNNPYCQRVVLEHGLAPILIDRLQMEDDPKALCRVLSSISGLIRDNIPAQDIFKFGNIFEQLMSILHDQNHPFSVKMRAVVVLKHFCRADPENIDTILQTSILAVLPQLTQQNENIDLSEQTQELMTLLEPQTPPEL